MELKPERRRFTYTKLINAKRIDSDPNQKDWDAQDDSIQNVEVFDSTSLVPVPNDRNFSPFIATSFLTREPRKYFRHQSVRFTVALKTWPEIEKLLVFFETENWPLFDRQARELDFGGDQISTKEERIRFVIRPIDAITIMPWRPLGRPQETINEIVKGKAAITRETAIELGRLLRISADCWINRDRQYLEFG
jgi:hypothetical protein